MGQKISILEQTLLMIYVLDSHFSTGHTSLHTLKTLEASQDLAFVVCEDFCLRGLFKLLGFLLIRGHLKFSES